MAFTSITLKTNITHNNLGIVAHCSSRNDNLSGFLFVPSQLSVSELPNREKSLSESEKEELDFAWERHLSRSRIPTKSGGCHLSLPLSKIMLFPSSEYMDLNKDAWDHMNETNCKYYQPIYDGPIVVVDSVQYLSLKEQKLMKFPSKIVGNPISSLGHWLVTGGRWLSLISLRKKIHIGGLSSPENIGCHLSSPFLDDIQKKDRRLALHRFACCPKPWNCSIMAIDKSSGYLVYNNGFVDLMSFTDCWIVLDSITSYTTGDLIYFNKDANFYVLPNAQCGDLQVWKFENRICSKVLEINATFMDEHEHPNSYDHIHSYLVESLSGNLLLVRRYVAAVVIQKDHNDLSCDDNFFKTESFEVFKLNFETKTWEVVPSLGDEAIFVGSNSSFCLSSATYTEVIPNCIYFTDQICQEGGDMLHGNDNGIFHLENCTFTTLFNPDFKCMHAPLWLCPDERPWNQKLDEDGDS